MLATTNRSEIGAETLVSMPQLVLYKLEWVFYAYIGGTTILVDNHAF